MNFTFTVALVDFTSKLGPSFWLRFILPVTLGPQFGTGLFYKVALCSTFVHKFLLILPQLLLISLNFTVFVLFLGLYS